MDKQMIMDTLDEIRGKAELFYQQKTGEALQQFDGVLQKILAIVDAIFAYEQEHKEFELDADKLKGTLTEAMQALEEGDMVLLADIIQYDFIEYVEQLLDQMQ